MAEPGYRRTRRRVLTRRGVLWLGQTCNLKCHFCYFIDRIGCAEHPEHAFMSIHKARLICRVLREFYGNNAVDIQGGEPTIYPQIDELVRHCREIGLLPTLISNGIALASERRCRRLVDAGIRDVLVSVHGLGETYDEIVGVPGSHRKLRRGIDNLRALEVPVRFNCVLSQQVLPQLAEIARLAIATGARVVNFIAFNPFEDQGIAGKRSRDMVPRYREVAPRLGEAMDLLSEAGVECNVRYFPLCLVEARHRPAAYNFQQLPYDIHEWDLASWTWTGMTPQRMQGGSLTRPETLAERASIVPAQLRELLDPARHRLALVPPRLQRVYRARRQLSLLLGVPRTRSWGRRGQARLYREDARRRAREDCKYVYGRACADCDLREICDGFHGDYAALFGTDEARSVRVGARVRDPRHYIQHQSKIVEVEDHDWAL